MCPRDTFSFAVDSGYDTHAFCFAVEQFQRISVQAERKDDRGA